MGLGNLFLCSFVDDTVILLKVKWCLVLMNILARVNSVQEKELGYLTVNLCLKAACLFC